MTPPRYWRHEVICMPDSGVHLGCEHAATLPPDPPNVLPAPRRMCKRKLHDLNDPGNVGEGRRGGCRPCKNAYQANLRRGRPLAQIRAPLAGDHVYSGPNQLSPAELARLRAIAACRCCGAQPAECKDGRVRISHALTCGGNIDSVDRRGRLRRRAMSTG